jgi:alanyl-tRNA synthetase
MPHTTGSIRHQFLEYFKGKGHTIVPSASVVPHEDPSLLFTNAGMNPFKDLFLGKNLRDYKRAVTIQKCIRAGGKHNDLENVGHTSRHLTFFEMLGNFSFGDYFKADAIRFAWEVSTSVFCFEPDRIWPSVYKDDDEAFELWTEYVPAASISRFGETDNFWSMGDTGPCGPCSELYYDRGEKYGNASTPLQDTEGVRYLEFWNLVFMQYNRSTDGIQVPLPKPSIDTGAGLERILMLAMGADSVFETDVLRGLIGEIEHISKISYNFHDPLKAPAFRVIADHLRSLSFAIADGAQPSNVERGYVLRKILRRAVRYGRILGLDKPFLASLLPTLIALMGADYHELAVSQEKIAEILTQEEEAFLRTLRKGGNLLTQVIERAKQHTRMLSGDDAFKLKDTYGLPFEEITLLAKDAELMVDAERYQQLEEEARIRSRSTQKNSSQGIEAPIYAQYFEQNGPTQFLGYSENTVTGSVKALIVDGKFVEEMGPQEKGVVLLDKTPFYAEMGGQIGDTGILIGPEQKFVVSACNSPFKGVIAHIGELREGNIKVGQTLHATIDMQRRNKIANNHTATHLLHWALQEILGAHIRQAGSVVEPGRLRFDFSHHKALSEEEMHRLEDLVNQKIRENICVKGYEISYEQAQQQREIKQFFGEKYGSQVRVIDMGFSKELCGGTHVSATGNIGFFRIISEKSVAAGTRRIEAVSGEEAEAWARKSEKELSHLASLLKTQPQKLRERIVKLQEENKELSVQLKTAKKEQLASSIRDLFKQVNRIHTIPFLVSSFQGSSEELRIAVEEALATLGSGGIFLGCVTPEKCYLMAAVSEDLIQKGIKANEWIQTIAPIVGGSGGGKPAQAQAGGKLSEKLEEALSKAKEWFVDKIDGKE